MLRSYSPTCTNDDTVMRDAQDCEDEGEDIVGTPLDSTTFTNYDIASFNNGNGGFGANIESDVDDEDSTSESELEPESEDDTLDVVKATKALAIKKKKHTMKAAQAVTKRSSPERSARATKTYNKTTTTNTHVKGNRRKETSASDSDSPAKRTRSSARLQQPKTQITGYHEVEMVPRERTKKFTTRKTWIPEEKVALEVAVRRWWRAVGAARYNYPTKIVLPKKRSDDCWEWMFLQCQKVNEKFNGNEIGLADVAWKMSDTGLI